MMPEPARVKRQACGFGLEGPEKLWSCCDPAGSRRVKGGSMIRIGGWGLTRLALLVPVLACGGTQPADPELFRHRSVATRLEVWPAAVTLFALGDETLLTARILDRQGNVLEGEPVSWSTNDHAVAAVDGTGLVTAVDNGSATVTAASGSLEGTAAVDRDAAGGAGGGGAGAGHAPPLRRHGAGGGAGVRRERPSGAAGYAGVDDERLVSGRGGRDGSGDGGGERVGDDLGGARGNRGRRGGGARPGGRGPRGLCSRYARPSDPAGWSAGDGIRRSRSRPGGASRPRRRGAPRASWSCRCRTRTWGGHCRGNSGGSARCGSSTCRGTASRASRARWGCCRTWRACGWTARRWRASRARSRA